MSQVTFQRREYPGCCVPLEVRGLVSGYGMGRMESMKMRTMVSKGENGSDSGTVPKEDFV